MILYSYRNRGVIKWQIISSWMQHFKWCHKVIILLSMRDAKAKLPFESLARSHMKINWLSQSFWTLFLSVSEQSIFDGRLERDFCLSTDHPVVNQQYVPSQVENVTVSAARCIFCTLNSPNIHIFPPSLLALFNANDTTFVGGFKLQAKYAVFCFDIHFSLEWSASGWGH